MYELLRHTGYFEAYDQVCEAALCDTLARYPECVDEWILYSEDKRTTSGWYIKQEEDARYKVGYFSGKDGEDSETTYFDKIAACAAFIKHEVEEIRHGP
jgi:hypothetical protein